MTKTTQSPAEELAQILARVRIRLAREAREAAQADQHLTDPPATPRQDPPQGPGKQGSNIFAAQPR